MSSMRSMRKKALPDEKELAAEIERTQAWLQDQEKNRHHAAKDVWNEERHKNNTKLHRQKRGHKGAKGAMLWKGLINSSNGSCRLEPDIR